MNNCIEADTDMDEKLHEDISLKIRIQKLEEYKRLQDDQNKNILERNNKIIKWQIECQKTVSFIDDHCKKQIAENRAVSKHFDVLDTRISELEKWTRKEEDVVHKRLKDLEESKDCILKSCGEIDERITSFLNGILERIEKLENLSDFKKLEGCVIDGAQTHLTVLKMENRLKDLEEGYQALSSELSYLLRDKKNKSCVKTKDLTFEEALTAFKDDKTIKRKEWIILENNKLHTFNLRIHDILANDWEIVE